jgi:hypothetical protein
MQPQGFLKLRQKLFRCCRFIVMAAPFKPRYERTLVVQMLATENMCSSVSFRCRCNISRSMA